MRVKARLVGPTFLAVLAAVGVATAADVRLVDAARNLDTQTVKDLLRKGAPSTATQADGFTALHWAAQRDIPEMAAVLIRAGANVDAADNYGITPLSLACTNRSTRLVELLLSAGATPNVAQAYGETPLMTCARTGTLDAVRLLLAGGADVNGKETARGQTALMWAVAEGHLDVVRALLQGGAEVDARSTAGYTALVLAAREARLDITKVLLAAGANVNAAANDSTTALVVATVRGHTEHAEFLLKHGANPNQGPGFFPIHWAVGVWDTYLSDYSNGITNPDTEWSIFGGLPKGERLEFTKLLIAHGADVNARTRTTPHFGMGLKHANGRLAGATPFLIAAQANDVDVMRELVAQGADPKIPTIDGVTPLMVAAGVFHLPGQTRSTEAAALEAIKLCMALGADVNAVTKSGDTALHGAAWRHHANSIVTYLVEHGANMNVRNRQGWTPLVIAEGVFPGGNTIFSPTTTELLRKLGAEPSPPDVIRVPTATADEP